MEPGLREYHTAACSEQELADLPNKTVHVKTCSASEGCPTSAGIHTKRRRFSEKHS